MTAAPRGDGAATDGAAPATARRTHPKPAQSARRDRVRELLRRYHETHDPRAREELVELNSDLVHFVARRFFNRGEPEEDIEQVGFVGLINAIERFDPTLDNEFSTFATPTIMGEIRRHFRDRSWAVRVPRRLQENLLRVNNATQQLTTALGRSPTIPELADAVGMSQEDVLAALEVAPAQHTISFDTPRGDAEDAATLGDRLGGDDDNLERVEMRHLLEQVMAHLTPREREIMALRFIDELPQTEVAKRLGISQMHVSRLQRAAIDHVRRHMEDGVPV